MTDRGRGIGRRSCLTLFGGSLGVIERFKSPLQCHNPKTNSYVWEMT